MTLERLPFHIDLAAWQAILVLIGTFISSAFSAWLGWRNTISRNVGKSLARLKEIHPLAGKLFTGRKLSKAEKYKTDSDNLGSFSDTVTSGFETLALLLGMSPAVVWVVFQVFPGIPPFLGVAVSLVVVSEIRNVVGIPFSYLETFFLEERYGMNRMSRRLYVSDELKGLATTFLFSLPALSASALFLQEFASFTIGGYFMLLGGILAAGPVWEFVCDHVIMRMFNRFEPLGKGPLRKKIEALLRKCGMEASSIVVVDSGKRSAEVNAYVHGFGRKKRIVLFDELLKKQSDEEVVSVVAHELGHARLHHLLYGRILSVASTAVAAAISLWVMNDVSVYHAFGFRFVTEEILPSFRIVGFGFAAAMIGTVAWILSPFVARLSRKMEMQADAFSAKLCGKDGLRTSLLKMHSDNLSDLFPDPLYESWNYSHPSILPRLEAIGRVEDENEKWSKTSQRKNGKKKCRRRKNS